MSLLQQGLDAFRQRQQQRADARLNYQLAQRPVTQEEILARELALADAAEVPMDTEQGVVLQPQLAQLIAEGMALQSQDTPQQPLAQELAMQDVLPMIGNFLRATSPSNPLSLLGQGAVEALQGNLPRIQDRLPQRPPMVEAEPLMQELNTSPNEGLFTAQPSAIAQELMSAGQAQAPAEASFGQRLTDMFQRPETQEFILQTLLGLARSESVGDALTGGVTASRALGQDLQSRPAREAAAERAGRKEEAEIRRLETQSAKDLADATKASAEIKKLSAETQKLLTDTPDKLDDKEYFQVWTPVFKEVVAGEYLKDESEANLTSEELATKIVNSRFDTANRRFVTPGAEAESRLRFLQNQVDSGAIPEQEIIDMVKHYSESIYGPANTAELINRLKGN